MLLLLESQVGSHRSIGHDLSSSNILSPLALEIFIGSVVCRSSIRLAEMVWHSRIEPRASDICTQSSSRPESLRGGHYCFSVSARDSGARRRRKKMRSKDVTIPVIFLAARITTNWHCVEQARVSKHVQLWLSLVAS
jgi:hypothetical protein